MKMNQANPLKISVSETLKSAFYVWKENFVTIAIVITLVFIPVQMLIEWAATLFDSTQDYGLGGSTSEWKSLGEQVRVYNMIRQLIGVIATLSIYNFVYNLQRKLGDERGPWQLFKFGLRKWPENFVQSLFAGIIILLYTLLLIVPGIYKMVQLNFVTNLVADEENDPLEKSKALVHEKWWDVFGMLLLIWFIALLIEAFLALPIMLLPESFFITVLAGVVVAIATSYALVVKGVYYLKLKELKAEVEVDAGVPE